MLYSVLAELLQQNFLVKFEGNTVELEFNGWEVRRAFYAREPEARLIELLHSMAAVLRETAARDNRHERQRL